MRGDLVSLKHVIVFSIFIASVTSSVLILDANQAGDLGMCPPATSFNHTYDTTNDTLTIEKLREADTLSPRVTVDITDAETNQTKTIVWLSDDDPSREIRHGDSITIADSGAHPRVPFDLNPGDHIHIQWTGSLDCAENNPLHTTLAEFTIDEPSH